MYPRLERENKNILLFEENVDEYRQKFKSQKALIIKIKKLIN